MNETGPPPTSVVPSAPPAGPAAPPPAASPAPRPFLGRLAGAFLFLLRRPGRTAVVVVLTALIGVGAWMVGVQAWGYYQLAAARRAVERYHNRQARDHLQAYLKVWPQDPAALLLAARTARRTGAFAEAEDLLNSFEGLRGKDDQDLILERVLLQAQRGRVDKVSAFCLARVRDNDPSAPLVLEAQTAGLLRTYRVVEADERMKTWLKLKPDDCQALLFQGIWYDLRGQTPEASANYRRVIDLDPENEEARMRLTALLLQTHEARDALPHLEYLRKGLGDDPRVLVRIAQCRVELGQTDEAKKILDGVLARHPHSAEALAARGELALEDGRPEQAEKWLREAVARDPGASETRYHFYQCLSRLGKTAEAEEEDRRLEVLKQDLKDIEELMGGKMQASPNDPALHYQAGMIALRAGADDDGVRWLESALDLDPHHAPAHRALAAYYEQVGDRGRAAQHRAAAQAAGDDGGKDKGKP